MNDVEHSRGTCCDGSFTETVVRVILVTSLNELRVGAKVYSLLVVLQIEGSTLESVTPVSHPQLWVEDCTPQ